MGIKRWKKERGASTRERDAPSAKKEKKRRMEYRGRIFPHESEVPLPPISFVIFLPRERVTRDPTTILLFCAKSGDAFVVRTCAPCLCGSGAGCTSGTWTTERTPTAKSKVKVYML